MASHYQRLKAYMPADFKWPDSKSAIVDTLNRAGSFQAPNGGMCYYIAADRYVSPYLSAYTALAFNWLRESGQTIPAPVEEKLHASLTKLIRRDILPGFYTRGMASTDTAVAQAAQA